MPPVRAGPWATSASRTESSSTARNYSSPTSISMAARMTKEVIFAPVNGPIDNLTPTEAKYHGDPYLSSMIWRTRPAPRQSRSCRRETMPNTVTLGVKHA